MIKGRGRSVAGEARGRLLYISHSEGSVDGFVRELTFAKRLAQLPRGPALPLAPALSASPFGFRV